MFSPHIERTAGNETQPKRFRSTNPVGRPRVRIFPTEWDDETFRQKGIEGLVKSLNAYLNAGYKITAPHLAVADLTAMQRALHEERSRNSELKNYITDLKYRLNTLLNPPPNPHKAQTIIREVAQKHEMTYAMIIGNSRAVPVVRARHEAMYRLRHELELSFPMIGKHLGNRDHSTAQHGVKAHAKRLKNSN